MTEGRFFFLGGGTIYIYIYYNIYIYSVYVMYVHLFVGIVGFKVSIGILILFHGSKSLLVMHGQLQVILLMEEILHHLGYIKPCK